MAAYTLGIGENVINWSRRFGTTRAPLWLGGVAALVVVASATALIYPLEKVAPAVSLSVVYLPGILLVSAYWGLVLGLVTSLLSGAAFNFFHIPPVGRFTVADSRNWVALAAFTLVAIVVSTLADVARTRTSEAERRRAEADLAAAVARDLLGGAHTTGALNAAAHRISVALDVPSALLTLGAEPGTYDRVALPLRSSDGEQIATLLLPAGLDPDVLARSRNQVVPALEALVAIALHRDAVQQEAVETAALRRSDELKTALLRAVSHDLRTPLTSIVAAGHALGSPSLTKSERQEMSAAVVEEGERLSTLVDKLLDLSRLQSGRAEPHPEWVSIEDVLMAARDAVHPAGGDVHLRIDPDLPAIRGDGAQLQQVFVNLLENARRYSGERPVTILARRSGNRVLVRVVDQGPGIAPVDRERIFEPFYRGATARAQGAPGSGLGLAIARGFADANGGRISVDSLPGQGTSFAVEFPVPDPATAEVGG